MNLLKNFRLIVLILLVYLILILLIYIVESSNEDSNIKSIFDAIWYSFVTLTTVGYGDVYPISFFGKIIAGAIALLGIGMVGLPAGILASAFGEISRQTRVDCPHCGKPVS